MLSTQTAFYIGSHAVQSFDLVRKELRAECGNFGQACTELADGLKPRAVAQVVVSDAHCRYLVLPRPAGVRNRAELDAAVGMRFNTVFGDATAWALKRHSPAWTERDFVVGLRKDMLAEIHAGCQAARLKLRSVKPHWIALAARLRRQTSSGAHWIVSDDGSWGAVGYVKDGQCLHLRSLRTDARPSLQELLAREQAFLAEEVPDAPVWTADLSPLTRLSSLTAGSGGALWDIGGAAL